MRSLLLALASSCVAFACGGKVSGGQPVPDGDDVATPATAPSAPADSSDPPPTGTDAPMDCANGKTTLTPINGSLCQAQLRSQTTTCDGATICGWTVETPCSLGYEDCNDSCDRTRPAGVPPGRYCWSGFGDAKGRITNNCGNCGR